MKKETKDKKQKPKGGDERSMKLGEVAERLMALFRSNDRSTGVFKPQSGDMATEHRAAQLEDWAAHVCGTRGVGCVPILDDGTCWWGAIDIDNHGHDEDIPIAPIDERIMSTKLPLIACRSKSGGVHCYVFMRQATPAAKLRGHLTAWASQLGYHGAEVFPKQAILRASKETGKQQYGNWINMPYLAGNDTVRYAFRAGTKLSLPEFVELAERSRTTARELDASTILAHEQAPPCVQRMMTEGVAAGFRNEGMYNLVIYLKRAYPAECEKMAEELNAVVFAKPLPRSELKRTITSAARPDYSYRCGEEPIRSLCDRDTCVKRKFGITAEEFDSIAAISGLPEFTDLVKYMAEPVRWEFKIDGVRVTNIETPRLLEWRTIRELIADRLTRIVPMIKNQEWERILQPMMASVRIVETPDDASIAGVIRARLREFASKTDFTNRGENTEDRKALMRALPVVQKIDGDRCVVFRAQDFVQYLKRTKSEELKGVNLWFAVKDIGIQHTRMRIGDHNINVWYAPVKEVLQDVFPEEAVEFKAEL